MPRTIAPLPNTVQVMFRHDMDSSWYEMQCPDEKLNGSYDKAASIEKIAKKNNWEIKWYGNEYYNPWRKDVK